MDRRSELEHVRRSLAMAQPRSMAMTREDAMAILTELSEAQAKLDRLRQALRLLADDASA
jgi:hypothetical protein